MLACLSAGEFVIDSREEALELGAAGQKVRERERLTEIFNLTEASDTGLFLPVGSNSNSYPLALSLCKINLKSDQRAVWTAD